MELDLDALLAEWSTDAAEAGARIVRGLGDRELVQFRIEMGILQMEVEGDPDGRLHAGYESVLDYARTRLAADEPITEEDAEALLRELSQYNYRRIALTNLADYAYSDDDYAATSRHTKRALADIRHCEAVLRLLRDAGVELEPARRALCATLVLNRARLTARQHTLAERHDDAIYALRDGTRELEDVLESLGFDDDRRAEDPGVRYLSQLAERLRSKHRIHKTLHEQLEEALAAEDYEKAALLRDQLSRRDATRTPEESPAPPKSA